LLSIQNVLRKFLPKKFELGTGFVIKPKQKGGEHDATSQIDIIVYDTGFPVYFREGDFVILSPDAVRAIISVKENLYNQNTQKVYDDCNSIGKFIHSGKMIKDKALFNGLFSFDGFDGQRSEFHSIEENLQSCFNIYYDNQTPKPFGINKTTEFKYILNHISINRDYFVKHVSDDDDSRIARSKQGYSFYRIQKLSFSFFISNLLEYLTQELGVVKHDRKMWYPEDKENSLLNTFYLSQKKE